LVKPGAHAAGGDIVVRSNALDPRQIRKSLRDETALDVHLPDSLQLASLGGIGRPDRTLPHLCRALVGALAGHLLPGGALLAGHGTDRLLVFEVLQAAPAQPRAGPAS